jgi:hypothetical protein
MDRRLTDQDLINSLGSNLYKSKLACSFFSRVNFESLHTTMRYRVYRKTGKTISRQSDTELLVIMQSVYLQNAKNREDLTLISQIKELNEIVLEYAVDNIVVEIEHYLKFVKDVNSLPINLIKTEDATKDKRDEKSVELFRF